MAKTKKFGDFGNDEVRRLLSSRKLEECGDSNSMKTRRTVQRSKGKDRDWGVPTRTIRRLIEVVLTYFTRLKLSYLYSTTRVDYIKYIGAVTIIIIVHIWYIVRHKVLFSSFPTHFHPSKPLQEVWLEIGNTPQENGKMPIG